MNCPNCNAGMTSLALDAIYAGPFTVDVCVPCQAFWFDKRESLKLSPASTLKLMKFVGENSSAAKQNLPSTLRCPRCESPLLMTHDMQRSTKFSYWRCANEHGRFIGFLDFLREKNFIRPLSAAEIAELRKTIPSVNCSNCGAAVDLAAGGACAHCGSALSLFDMKQPGQLVEELKRAAAPRPVDPALPLDLARVKREVETAFGETRSGDEWSSSSLVHAGLSAFARWLSDCGI